MSVPSHDQQSAAIVLPNGLMVEVPSCPQCGAFIANLAQHREWHSELNEPEAGAR